MNYNVLDSVKPLLTSDNCEKGKYLAWSNEYRHSRIVNIQLGHDHLAYENPSYRILIKNAIEWTSNKK